MDIISEIKKIFKKDILAQLIIINLAVYVAIKIISVFLFLFASGFSIDSFMVEWFAVPSGLKKLLFRFWTPVTYNFLHVDFWHILGNMLWLFFLGRVFLMFIDQKKFFANYILGGLSGAALYILAFNIFPVFSDAAANSIPALGASASVTAIVIGIAVYKPDYSINFFGILPIKLKWIAVFFIIYDLISIPGNNAGGHIAHLGGAGFGLFFALQLKKGQDITKGFNKFMDNVVSFFKSEPKMKVTYKKENFKQRKNEVPKSDLEYNKAKSDKQAEVDRILDKISKHGYDSLSKKEKEFLFRISGKDKD